MRAIGYVRVSTEEQAREGVSLDAQRARFAAWCDARGIAAGDRGEHADEGLSGKRADNRPGLQAALAAACAAPCALVVYSLSRMARSTLDAIAIAQRLRAAGADLVSLSESLDTTTASGRMFFGFLAVLAEFERELIAERTAAALAHKRGRGERCGAVPRGKRLVDDGRRSREGRPVALADDPDELAALDLIRALAGDGRGARAIARLLADRPGRPWPESTIRRVLKRATP